MTADDYLRRVDTALRDLAWSQRRELLAELRSHLAELPAGTDLRELGTPEEYAADLRSVAGLEGRHGPVAFLRARRPRNVLLVILALALIALGIGAGVWLGITIQNTGKFTVRVLGVPYVPALPFSARLLMSLPQRREEFLPPYVRFRPFDVEPGDMRLLLLKGVYACRSGMQAGVPAG